jgi:hypothetical protein
VWNGVGDNPSTGIWIHRHRTNCFMTSFSNSKTFEEVTYGFAIPFKSSCARPHRFQCLSQPTFCWPRGIRRIREKVFNLLCLFQHVTWSRWDVNPTGPPHQPDSKFGIDLVDPCLEELPASPSTFVCRGRQSVQWESNLLQMDASVKKSILQLQKISHSVIVAFVKPMPFYRPSLRACVAR